MYDAALLIQINRLIGESGSVIKPNELHSAFAGLEYWSTDVEKMCSIVRSVMQGHPFLDGNKRTATLLLLAALPVRATDDEVVEMATTSVIGRWPVATYVRWVQDHLAGSTASL